MRFALGIILVIAIGGLLSGVVAWLLAMLHPVAGIASAVIIAPLIGCASGEIAYRVSWP